MEFETEITSKNTATIEIVIEVVIHGVISAAFECEVASLAVNLMASMTEAVS